MIAKTNPKISSWSWDDGYKNDWDIRSYPYRAFNALSEGSLDFKFRLHTRDKHVHFNNCRHSGFEVYLHMPGETTIMARQSFRFDLNDTVKILIKPSLITTSNGLRSYRPNQRGCFFNFERQLRFLKMYTQSNCEAECLVNYTLKKCGCVKYSMPSNMQNVTFLHIYFQSQIFL